MIIDNTPSIFKYFFILSVIFKLLYNLSPMLNAVISDIIQIIIPTYQYLLKNNEIKYAKYAYSKNRHTGYFLRFWLNFQNNSQ